MGRPCENKDSGRAGKRSQADRRKVEFLDALDDRIEQSQAGQAKRMSGDRQSQPTQHVEGNARMIGEAQGGIQLEVRKPVGHVQRIREAEQLVVAA